MKAFTKSSIARSFTAVIALALVGHALIGNAQAERFQGLDVTVEGKGPAIVFIPGLNSGKETFVDTCKALKAHYTCHLLTLPGFAGNAPIAKLEGGFVEPMRDVILAYIKAKKLAHPIIMGHSLGGATALMIAEKAPDVPSALVIVDSLPFYSAIQNPAATAAAMLPIATGMRTQMLAQPLKQYQDAAAQMVTKGMSNQASRLALLQAWSKSSDRATTAQAMVDLMTIDLRDRVANIKTPTLVLGAWAAYKPYGSTQESTKLIFQTQYQKLPGVRIEMSASAYHFISWDDPKWLVQQTTTFLSQNKAQKL